MDGNEMQKWENANRSLIGRTGNLAATGRGVVGDEDGKVLDEKMQKKKVHMKDVTEQQLKVVRCIEHGALK